MKIGELLDNIANGKPIAMSDSERKELEYEIINQINDLGKLSNSQFDEVHRCWCSQLPILDELYLLEQTLQLQILYAHALKTLKVDRK